jgi:hypothetical protein
MMHQAGPMQPFWNIISAMLFTEFFFLLEKNHLQQHLKYVMKLQDFLFIFQLSVGM